MGFGGGEMVVEACQHSLAAFAVAFESLRNCEAILAPAFVSAIVNLDVGEHVETMVEYLRIVGDEGVFGQFFQSFQWRLAFLNDVLEDVDDGGIVPDDLLPLFPPIRVLAGVGRREWPFADQVRQRREKCERVEVVERVGSEELATLARLLAECGV
jgi:hypothetical protein